MVEPQRTPFNLFISHIHEEAEIADVLRKWFHAVFPAGLVSAFVSSDYEDNPLGGKWLEVIDAAMDRSRLLVTLLSPRSIDRMWIHLETGWALGRKIDVLPICHGGIKLGELPRPYLDYGGTEVDRDDFARRLLMALKQRLGLDHPLPDGLLLGLANDVRAACSRAAKPHKATPSAEPKRAPSVPDPTSEAGQLQLRVLSVLADLHDRGREEADPGEIGSAVGISPSRATLVLQRLTDARLVHGSPTLGEGTFYSIARPGLELLEREGLL